MLGGIFVGGAGTRMNGAAKGMLRTDDDETIVERIARAMRDAGVEPVLVGKRVEYESLGMRVLGDAMSASGPLGGLVALLEAARGGEAIAIACDMPHVTTELVKKLASAPHAAAVAPKRDGRWEPLFARYDASRVLDVARARCARRELALQGLLDEVGATALTMDEREARALVDWDTPMDVRTQTTSREILAFDDGRSEARADRVAIEEPLEIRLGRDAFAVTMRTPGADVDLAAGFLVGEGIVSAREDIVAIAPSGPHAVSIVLSESARARTEGAARRFFVTSSCGVCGKESIERVRAIAAVSTSSLRVDARAISAMPDALRAAQSAFDRTGALHAAGLFELRASSAELVGFAEDVGRHNALDKVLGAEFLAGRFPLARHAIVLSGRVAFELVQKSAMAGVSIIVAIGAPTSLAIELAQSAKITLVGFARGARFNVYTEPSRVVS
jgi:FdhD protein